MNRQYIGARYVPKIFDFEGSAEWKEGMPYEALTVVTFGGNSYTSKKPVPSNIGNPSVNIEYWVNTGNYNAQIENYRKETEILYNKVNSEIGITVPNGNIDDILDKYSAKETIFIFNGENYNMNKSHSFNKRIIFYSPSHASISFSGDCELKFNDSIRIENVNIIGENTDSIVDKYLINTFGKKVEIYNSKIKQDYNNPNSNYDGTTIYVHNAEYLSIINSEILYSSESIRKNGGALFCYTHTRELKANIVNSIFSNNSLDEVIAVYGEYDAYVNLDSSYIIGYENKREFSITSSSLSDNNITLALNNCKITDTSCDNVFQCTNANNNDKNGYARIICKESNISGNKHLIYCKTNNVDRKENCKIAFNNCVVTINSFFNMLYNAFIECQNSIFNFNKLYDFYIINHTAYANIFNFVNCKLNGEIEYYEKSKDIFIATNTSYKTFITKNDTIFNENYNYDINESQKNYFHLTKNDINIIRPLAYFNKSINVASTGNNITNLFNKSYFDNRTKLLHCDLQFQIINTSTEINITLESYGGTGNNYPVLIYSSENTYFGTYNGLNITSAKEIPVGYYYCKFIN